MMAKTMLVEIVTTRAKTTASRKAADLTISFIRMKHEAGGANGLDQRSLARRVDLPAQFADVNVDHIGLRNRAVVPDVFKQHGAGDDLVRMPHEIFEQVEFPRQQRDEPVATPHAAVDEIHV